MSQTRKKLKAVSIVVLALAGLSMLNLAFELFFGESFNSAEIPEGSPDNIILIAKIVVAVISFIVLLPQIYIGFKGIKVANNPDSSRAHIIWGFILFVLTLISLISPLMAIIKLEDVFANVAQFLSVAVDAAILFSYIRFSKMVSEGN